MAENKAERLLQVLLCFTSTRRPLTRAQLRAAVPDYGDCPTDDAFERMFERDKAELRDMGIPLRTVSVDPSSAEDDAYTVDASSWELPPVELTREEAQAVALAARLWHEDGTADAARRALRKLEARGVEVDADAVPAVEPRLGGGEGAFAPIQAAVQAQQVVTFDYRRSGATHTRTRRLEPWGLVSSRGRWYVVGHDRDREGPRVFRLSRVVGAVRPTGRPGAFEVPDGIDLRAYVVGLEDTTPPRQASLRVRRGAGHGLRLRAASETHGPEVDELEVSFRDVDGLADEVASYGPTVVVVAPEDLRDAVVLRLRRLAAVEVAG